MKEFSFLGELSLVKSFIYFKGNNLNAELCNISVMSKANKSNELLQTDLHVS